MNDKSLKIRKYQDTDASAVQEYLAQLQGYIAELDKLKQHIPYKDFRQDKYFISRLRAVKDNDGEIFVAEINGKPVGAVVGFVRVANGDNQVECYPQKIGYVSDLYIDKDFRGQGVGEELMSVIERHFKARDVDFIALSCMADNNNAREFYWRLDYEDYSVRMVKKVEK